MLKFFFIMLFFYKSIYGKIWFKTFFLQNIAHILKNINHMLT